MRMFHYVLVPLTQPFAKQKEDRRLSTQLNDQSKQKTDTMQKMRCHPVEDIGCLYNDS